jgi:hypothetical protein
VGLGFGLGIGNEISSTYIYVLIDPRDSAPKYIGKADDLKERLRKHLGEKTGTKKTNWLRLLFKMGLKPTIEEIDCVDKNEWQFWERHYISLYRSWGFDLKNGTDGGDGNCSKRSDETKARIRAARALQIKTRKGVPCSEETKELLRQARKLQKGTNKGRMHTEQTKSKIREKRLNQAPPTKGRKVSDTTKDALRRANNKSVCQYTKDSVFIKEWESVKKAREAVKGGHISDVANGKRGSAGGFLWKFKKLEEC